MERRWGGGALRVDGGVAHGGVGDERGAGQQTLGWLERQEGDSGRSGDREGLHRPPFCDLHRG